LISLTVLVLLFVVTDYAPRPASVWVPVLAAVQIVFTLGIVMLFSSVLLYLRDLRHALPIILQFGIFATPVAYGLDRIPEKFRLLYSMLNPLAPVIDGYRRTILFDQAPNWGLLGPAALVSVVWLVVGYTVFRRLERGFADIA
jgi:ABC-2 type transport system permease protein/lipopolysaccharide transport system permease protein